MTTIAHTYVVQVKGEDAGKYDSGNGLHQEHIIVNTVYVGDGAENKRHRFLGHLFSPAEMIAINIKYNRVIHSLGSP